MVMEHEFLAYIVRHTYDRDSLRQYITDYLAPELEKFICGGIARGTTSIGLDAFSVGTFVHEAVTQYACRTRPGGRVHALPSK